MSPPKRAENHEPGSEGRKGGKSSVGTRREKKKERSYKPSRHLEGAGRGAGHVRRAFLSYKMAPTKITKSGGMRK